MKDGNPTVLYTKETRVRLRPALYLRARRATEQQSNRALCRSHDPCSVRLSSAWQEQAAATTFRVVLCLRPSLHYPPPGLAQSLELCLRGSRAPAFFRHHGFARCLPSALVTAPSADSTSPTASTISETPWFRNAVIVSSTIVCARFIFALENATIATATTSGATSK